MRSFDKLNMRGFWMGALLLLPLLAGAGCGSSPAAPTPPATTPPPPTAGSLEGNWTGTVVHPQAGIGTATFMLGPRSSLLGNYRGTWRMSFVNPAHQREGQVDLFSDGPRIDGLLDGIASLSPCFNAAFAVRLQRDGNRLTGDVVFGLCEQEPALGTITLLRQ